MKPIFLTISMLFLLQLSHAQVLEETNPTTKCYLYSRANGTIEMFTFQKPKKNIEPKISEYLYYYSSEFENNLKVEIMSFDEENHVYRLKLPISRELCKLTKTATGYIYENMKGEKKVFRRVDF